MAAAGRRAAGGAAGAPGPRWFVKTETFAKPFPEVREHLEAHKAWVRGLQRRGEVAQITSGYRVDAEGRPGGGGLMFFQAESHAAAEALCRLDPLVKSGSVAWKVQGFVPEVGDIRCAEGGEWVHKRAQ